MARYRGSTGGGGSSSGGGSDGDDPVSQSFNPGGSEKRTRTRDETEEDDPVTRSFNPGSTEKSSGGGGSSNGGGDSGSSGYGGSPPSSSSKSSTSPTEKARQIKQQKRTQTDPVPSDVAQMEAQADELAQQVAQDLKGIGAADVRVERQGGQLVATPTPGGAESMERAARNRFRNRAEAAQRTGQPFAETRQQVQQTQRGKARAAAQDTDRPLLGGGVTAGVNDTIESIQQSLPGNPADRANQGRARAEAVQQTQANGERFGDFDWMGFEETLGNFGTAVEENFVEPNQQQVNDLINDPDTQFEEAAGNALAEFLTAPTPTGAVAQGAQGATSAFLGTDTTTTVERRFATERGESAFDLANLPQEARGALEAAETGAFLAENTAGALAGDQGDREELERFGGAAGRVLGETGDYATQNPVRAAADVTNLAAAAGTGTAGATAFRQATGLSPTARGLAGQAADRAPSGAQVRETLFPDSDSTSRGQGDLSQLLPDEVTLGDVDGETATDPSVTLDEDTLATPDELGTRRVVPDPPAREVRDRLSVRMRPGEQSTRGPTDIDVGPTRQSRQITDRFGSPGQRRDAAQSPEARLGDEGPGGGYGAADLARDLGMGTTAGSALALDAETGSRLDAGAEPMQEAGVDPLQTPDTDPFADTFPDVSTDGDARADVYGAQDLATDLGLDTQTETVADTTQDSELRTELALDPIFDSEADFRADFGEPEERGRDPFGAGFGFEDETFSSGITDVTLEDLFGGDGDQPTL